MNTPLETLKERGFIKQMSDENFITSMLGERKISFYTGFDPTGPSLHCGHLVPILAMRHLQLAGHHPLLLLGGGTARIGDPSDKDEIRKLISNETIAHNIVNIEKQVTRFLDLSEGKGKLLNNGDWLNGLKYIDFLRDVGRHFSVNRMLTFEGYRRRMETGLSFIEFNYMLLQSYDFYHLNRTHGCTLQLGGDEQWGNMVSGIDLIRRLGGKESAVMTFNLVTTSDGRKMGKTESGALYLDSAKTPVYDFYQYWRNVGDKDIEKMLLLYTFLPVETCREAGSAVGAEINRFKSLLAFEVTKLVHGEAEAKRVESGAKAAFGGGDARDEMPGGEIERGRLDKGMNALELFTLSGLCTSRKEARRLVEQGGALINGQKVTDSEALILCEKEELLLRAGKKRFFRFIII